jgi:hypothetical protein
MASSILSPRFTYRSTAWTHDSPSLVERTVIPSARNAARSSTLLTTLPLCAPTRSPSESRWGCAFTGEGAPKVAQRNCVMPRVPVISANASRSATAATFPTSLRKSTVPLPWKVAQPTES